MSATGKRTAPLPSEYRQVAGGISLRAEHFGDPRFRLIVVEMDHFFDWAMEVLAERGYRVDRKKRLVEGAGTG